MNNNSFQDVTSSAGIFWSEQKGTEAFSIAWLDFNNDGLLDLWISGHGYNGSSTQYPEGKYPYLYLNNGDGTFTNLFTSDWRNGSGGDIHGTTWVDFDNDGDQDFLAAGGGKLGDIGNVNLELLTNKFFVNNGGILEEEAVARGLDNAIARSRSSVWFDGNNDGLMDVVVVTAIRDDDQGYTAYFEQQNDGTFIDRTVAVGLDVNESSRYAQLADLTGDGKLDLVIQGTYTWPLGVYDFSNGTTFQDVTNTIPQISDAPEDPTLDFVDHSAARDSIIADFNNDGKNDIFLARSYIFTPEPSIFQGSDTIVSADLVLQQGGEIGVSFQTNGLVAFDSFDFNGQDAEFAGFDASNIFIGADGRNPTEAELEAIFTSGYDPDLTSGSCAFCGSHSSHSHTKAAFELDPNDTTVVGLKSDRTARGIYLGYEPNTSTWEIRISSPTNEIVRIAVESDQNITNFQEIGFVSADPNSRALSDRFLVYDDVTGEYVDLTTQAGFASPTLAHSAVAADFDNDMDLDIYIANAYPSFNQPNILYENQGDGTFTKVAQAGGAAGSEIGPHRLDFEIGQRLAIADYDNDGFVDIFAGSTTAKSPRKTYLGTPSQLFRNYEGDNGNTNNWIQIDLEGFQSNRDGVGARVEVTAGGITQMREQNGGLHVFAQNSQRLHFGLANNTQIDSIVVKWSSGLTQTLTNVAVNQILEIKEIDIVPAIVGDAGDNLINGTTGADKIFGYEGNDTLNGGDRNDFIRGGDGNDSLVGGSGSDTLNGDLGADTINGGIGSDVLNGGFGADSLVGGSGNDTLSAGADNDTLFGNSGNDNLFADTGEDLLDGGSGDDTLDAGADNDTLFGNSGNDNLFAHSGEDLLDGGSGNDTLNAGAGNDTLFGGANDDLLIGDTGSDYLAGDKGKDTLEGGEDDDTLLGGEGHDLLVGGLGDDSLNGQGGNDNLEGGDGNDILRGGNGDDTLVGGAGSDRLLELNNSNFKLTNTQLIARGTDVFSEFELARLVGGVGNNLIDAGEVTELRTTLEGGSGNDTLIGGSQDDFLIGGVGADITTGGAGKDRFVFNSKNHGTDIITDFTPADDTLVFSAAGFGGGLAVNQTITSEQFTLGVAAADSSDRFIYDPGNGNLFFDADGTGTIQAILVATLNGNPALTSDDIFAKA